MPFLFDAGFVYALDALIVVGVPLRVALGVYGLFALLLDYVSHAMLSELFLRWGM
jgi:hypothetical protein